MQRTSDGTSVLDYGESVYDDTFDFVSMEEAAGGPGATVPDGAGSADNWQEPTQFSSHLIERTFAISYSKGPRTSNKYRHYGVQVSRQKNAAYMNVRVRDARMSVHFSAD